MPRKPTSESEGALYVRLPAQAFSKLDRASAALGVHKKDLIAGLVTKYLDPDSRTGLAAGGTLAAPRRINLELGDNPPAVGAYSFQPYDPPEVLNPAQAADLLQLDQKLVLELAEAGQLPGRKLGPNWRFSRAALVAWLSTPEKAR
jgi:excisionase family DNA binding protein